MIYLDNCATTKISNAVFAEMLPYLKEILKYTDVLVDGAYIDELRDISLPFRGSSNQRIIDVPKSLEQNKVILWQE